jgi:hypothetical protein
VFPSVELQMQLRCMLPNEEGLQGSFG